VVLVMCKSLDLGLNLTLILPVKQAINAAVLGATPRSKRHETDYKQES
jgi:hypothetical protein